ncbi:hypothetical protein ACWGLF_45615 [Streptomyces puniciscabiei]
MRVTAPLSLHQATLGQCADLVGGDSAPAGVAGSQRAQALWEGFSLAARGVRLSASGTLYGATGAEFEPDLLRLRTREDMAVARANGRLKGK